MAEKINRKYKDRLFCMIFKKKENALSLYNALRHTHYTNPDEIEINTLDDVIYMHLKNDVSFIIDGYMNLLEHQSTFNSNMPLRSLMYFAEEYSAYVEQNDLDVYGSKMVKIPTPQTIVMYNGDSKREAKEIFRLSDQFLNPEEAINHQWTAVIYNINKGYNEDLLGQCRPLYEYSYFVNLIKENKKNGLELREAIDQAVNVCIEKDIMAKFLRKHRGEVLDVCLTEFNEKRVLKHRYEDGKEDGIEIGKEIGIEIGKEIGEEIGEEIGKEIGKEIGEEKEKSNVIIALYREGMSLDFIVKIVNKDISEIKTILMEQGIIEN